MLTATCQLRKGKGMRPSLALTIGGAVSLLSGLLFLLAPDQVFAFAWPTRPDEMLVVARELGVFVIGVGLIDLMARQAVGTPLRGLLWGNIFIRAGSIVLPVWEFAVGIIPTTALAGLVGAVSVHAVLIIVFLLALRRA
jgi:hypothetical protein